MLVVEPTVMAEATRAGDELHAFALSCPRRSRSVTPELIEFATALSRAVLTPPPRLMFATAGVEAVRGDPVDACDHACVRPEP